MVKQWDDEWSVGSGYSRISLRRLDDGETCLEGEVATPHGWVVLYSQGDGKRLNHSRLDFIHQGRCFCRNFNKRYTQRGLVTKAKQFAKEIAEDKD